MSRSCAKVPYPSQAAAKVAATRLSEMNRPLGTYRCREAGCRAWHLTSTPTIRMWKGWAIPTWEDGR